MQARVSRHPNQDIRAVGGSGLGIPSAQAPLARKRQPEQPTAACDHFWTEIRCWTENKESFLTLFLPPDTGVPPKRPARPGGRGAGGGGGRGGGVASSHGGGGGG